MLSNSGLLPLLLTEGGERVRGGEREGGERERPFPVEAMLLCPLIQLKEEVLCLSDRGFFFPLFSSYSVGLGRHALRSFEWLK
jgi:hypothetical protein